MNQVYWSQRFFLQPLCSLVNDPSPFLFLKRHSPGFYPGFYLKDFKRTVSTWRTVCHILVWKRRTELRNVGWEGGRLWCWIKPSHFLHPEPEPLCGLLIWWWYLHEGKPCAYGSRLVLKFLCIRVRVLAVDNPLIFRGKSDQIESAVCFLYFYIT